MPALPSNPNLAYYRKRAKALLRAVSAGDREARERVRRHHPEFAAAFRPGESIRVLRLADAQWVVALELGFESWPRLKKQFQLRGDAPRCRLFSRDLDYYEGRAQGLESVHKSGLPNALFLIRQYHPRFAGATDEEIRAAEFTLADARLVHAREHGLPDWEALAAHVGALKSGEVVEPFAEAFAALENADLPALRTLLDDHPDLVRERGTNGNSLLNLASGMMTSRDYSRPPEPGNGTPERRMTIAELLVERGADPNLENDRGWTAVHQCGYSNLVELGELLIAAGGDVTAEAHGDGGTPLAMALFWGHREAAAFLAGVRVAPNNLRIAAGLDRIDLLREHFRFDGTLKPPAGRHRAFYRPHSGFPVWHPTSNPQEILDEALVWASKSCATNTAAFLIAHGADINADPYRGTPLIWAASCNRAEMVRWLLDRGAEVNRRATFGGPSHGGGVTALHLAAQGGRLESCRILVEHGCADPTIPDNLYHSPPWGWADHFDKTETRDYLLPRAAQTDLFAAISLGDEAQVRRLLEQRSPTLYRVDYWLTPLAKAVEAGKTDLVKLLREAGADPNQAAARGKSARDLAADKGDAATLEVLR